MSDLINLKKEVQISLKKKGVFGEKAHVVLVLDISASMSDLFSDNTVQELVERILAIGMNMDNNKEIDVYLFGERAHSLGPVSEDSIDGYVKNKIQRKYSLESYTKYAGVMRMVAKDFTGFDQENGNSRISRSKKKGFLKSLFGKKSEVFEDLPSLEEVKNKEATLVFFITDGDNHDRTESEEFIKDVSGESIFWQFIGIGDANFKFLKALDTMDGRIIDNANFFSANDIKNISNSQLYDRILDEFPSWLTESRKAGITK